MFAIRRIIAGEMSSTLPSSAIKSLHVCGTLKMTVHGQTWRDSKVDALINVWLNKATQTQLHKSYMNEPIYRKIEEEHRKRGIMHGWKQCCDKLKTYKDILDKLCRSSAGIESEGEDLYGEWRYF